MRLSLFLAVNFVFALDWRIKKAAFNDRNEKYEEIMAKIDSADTFDEIQVLLNYEPGIYQPLGPSWRGNGKKVSHQHGPSSTQISIIRPSLTGSSSRIELLLRIFSNP